RLCARRARRGAARPDLRRLPHHGARLPGARLRGGDRRRHGQHPRRRGGGAAARAGARARQPVDPAGGGRDPGGWRDARGAYRAAGRPVQPDRRRLMAAGAPLRPGVLGWIVPALLALAIVLPWLVGDFYLRLAIEALLLGAIALSVDILLGFGGLLSLGQAMYFGLSAYLTALCYLHLTQSFWLIAAIVAVAVALVAAALGAVAIRAKGVYFALIPFGVAEIAGKIVHNTRALGGSDGLLGIPVPAIGLPGIALPLRNNIVFYYVVLAVIALAYLAVRRILATPFGSVLSAIRDNASRVPYLGYN